MTIRRTLEILVCMSVVTSVSTDIYGENFMVAPGEPWPHTTQSISPGDTIYIAAGNHGPQVLNGLKGTAEQPIRIAPADPELPGTLFGGEWSLDVVDCQHVHIESLLFIANTQGGIRISGSPQQPSRGIRITGGYVARPGRPPGERIGIMARHTEDLSIDGTRVDAWGRAAVTVHDSKRVRINNVNGLPKMDARFGIELNTNVEDVEITDLKIQQLRGTGVRIGNLEKSLRTPATRSKNISINRCWFMDCDIAVSIANAENVRIDYCLLLDQTKCCVEILTSEDSEPPTNISMSWNTIQWEVGGISSFFCNVEKAHTFTLNPNLWWSQEMPEAAEYLGPFPKDYADQQVVTVDPKLTPRTLKQMNPKSFRFGPSAQITNENTSKPNDSAADNAEDLNEEKKKRE